MLQASPSDILNTAQNAAAPVAAASGSNAAIPGLHVFGVTLIGATRENGHKLILTIAFILITWAVGWAIRQLLKLLIGTRSGTRFQFWAKQGVSLVLAVLLLLGILSIWFDNPARLATAIGLIGAGLAFALQRVITAVAGYFVILRGKTFNVGDRIVMGGVRGDVIGLTFMQTRIMEMGQPPKVEEGTPPAMWVHGRQFTGRIVTVTNDQVFDEPVYNYTHEFPYIWDEISLPIHYSQDFATVDRLLLDAARKHALSRRAIGDDEVRRLKDRFGIEVGQIDPAVFWRMTENWLEITVRFLVPDHGVRSIKDEMSREILPGLEKAGIRIAAVRQEAVTVKSPVRRRGRSR